MIGTIIKDAYIGVITVGLLLYPLIVKHGYRAWWLDVFYAVLVIASIGGVISHSRNARPRPH